MLPSSQRLSVEQFNDVMKRGKVSHSPLFIIRTVKVDGKTAISAVAPQKIAKKAVERNKIRRIMYETIMPLMKSVVTGYNIVIIAKDTAVNAKFNDLLDGMKEIFVKAGLLK